MTPPSPPAARAPVAIDGVSRWSRLLLAVCLVSIVASLVMFRRLFVHDRPQLLVDGLWLLAILLWVAVVRLMGGGLRFGLTVRRAEVWPIALLVLVFAAAWLPFYDNWRWAFTGDSFSLFGSGYYLYTRGLHEDLLSVHGIDNSFTILWEVAYNVWVFVFGPNMLGHRFGLFVMSSLALLSIYAFFTATLGRAWGAAIAAAMALNYLFIWISYISYMKTDSFVFTYLTLLWAVLIWRDPRPVGRWLLCGLTIGLSLFFTPTAWSTLALVGALLGVYALATNRFSAAITLCGSVALVAAPILFELPWLLRMTASQAGPLPQWDYVVRILRAILLSPYESGIDRLGVQGAFLRWPLGSLHFVGIGLAALALLPPLRRRLRVPDIAPVLLGLYLWDAFLMSLTNKGYGSPSHKRTYNLLPLQVAFAILPGYVLYAWGARRAWWRYAVTCLVIAAIAVYGFTNMRLIMYPQRGVYGNNIFDGLIELRQRHPDRAVVLVTSREIISETLGRTGLFHVAYRIADRLTVSSVLADSTVEHACDAQALLCYEPNADRDRMQPILDRYQGRLRDFPLLNSVQLVCYECGPVERPRS